MEFPSLPITKSLFNLAIDEHILEPKFANFLSIKGRIICLACALIVSMVAIGSPILIVYLFRKEPKSNLLDFIIALIVAPILLLLLSVRCVLAALIHPNFYFTSKKNLPTTASSIPPASSNIPPAASARYPVSEDQIWNRTNAKPYHI